MQNIIVIGNGMVGFKFLEKFTEQPGWEHKYNLIAFGEEPRVAYDRVHLSEFFSGKTADDLSMSPREWYDEKGIELNVDEKVIELDRQNKVIQTSKGRRFEYDKLVLATGSTAFVPPVPGIEKEGVFVYRTIEDLEALTAYGEKSKSAAVVGGGLLGLEAAKAMVDMGLKTSVVEFASRLMPRQIDDEGSNILVSKIEELGVEVLLNRRTEEILGEGLVSGMKFAEHETLEVDMICVSAGIRPQDELALKFGLEVGPRGGIQVDRHMLTNDPDIYAIGECALFEGMIYGLVAPGYAMAETAMCHIMGDSKPFDGADMSTKLKLMGVDVASVGDPFLVGDNIKTLQVKNTAAGVYKQLTVDITDNTLKGAILVGDAADYGQLLQLYQNEMVLPEELDALVFKGGGESSLGGVGSLPDSAQICSCENVTKGQIVAAVKDGCQDVGSIKKCTKAGTGCGSCVTLVTDLLNSELEQSGIAVDKSLCEHFSYTRQELVELIKLSKLTTFDEVLEKHGKGHGCEICKPAIASILASTFNDYISNHHNIQDTNDEFLANIQRNGTYSVIPRVPGGELFPEQLIKMGEVAKKYNLYCKITGGQRVDLLGAHLQDLPSIWEELGEVGLESGHAYAKAVRTVKSCVGSQWCRFGVGDSTKLAIDIEHRYKGLRAPHKLKFAVSGCARECAEAQGKDVGIIATENGWNLYVCGNGGMTPQHAILLAADIDEETLMKYTDRFLMYYVRTADRLTRTATWLNKLPGGIDKVKAVVVEDSLGLADELEQEMQHIVETYQCEWKTTYTDPEKRKRYQHFINSNEKDSNIEMAMERGQLQPV